MVKLFKVVATSDEVERGEELLEESSEGQRLRWIAKISLLCSGSFDGVVVRFDVYTLYCFSPLGSSRTRSTRPI